MTFTAAQNSSLAAPLLREAVKTRAQGGRSFSFVEGWHVIAECNRIFGFDGWFRETVSFNCVAEKDRPVGENKVPGFGVTYICMVRVTAGGVVREGCGSGHGIDRDLGLAHESALKEAETDAMKRALMTFGNQFGLALYDKEQTNVASEDDVSRQQFLDECRKNIAAFNDEDRDGILRWWHSDEQRKARRDFELSPAEVTELKGLVTAKAKLPVPT